MKSSQDHSIMEEKNEKKNETNLWLHALVKVYVQVHTTIHGKVILLIASLIPLKICDNAIFPRQKLAFCKAFLERDTLLWNFFFAISNDQKKVGNVVMYIFNGIPKFLMRN